MVYLLILVVFFFKQKTAYEMRISDWSSDVCSSDLDGDRHAASRTRGRGSGGDGRPCACVRRPADRRAAPDFVIAAEQVCAPSRSDERRVGNECVSTCRSGWAPEH